MTRHTDDQDARFADVLGPGRGGGLAGSVPEALARFSVHPLSGLHLGEDRDPWAAVQAFAASVAVDAALLGHAAASDWQLQAVTTGGSAWVMAVKKFVTATQVAREVLSFYPGDELTVDYFPSGSVTQRAGMMVIHFTGTGEASIAGAGRQGVVTVHADGTVST